ncbi:hypothetical protein, partial [Pseudomonas aeruginosa]|uniref:hypothetical protein n=1 Tax=Pseudomonas aeruginosa TaxID=287 RepID=UPI003969DC99
VEGTSRKQKTRRVSGFLLSPHELIRHMDQRAAVDLEIYGLLFFALRMDIELDLAVNGERDPQLMRVQPVL